MLGGVRSPAYMVGRGLSGVEKYKEEMQSRRMISYSDDSNMVMKLERGGDLKLPSNS